MNIEYTTARDILDRTFADVIRDYIEGRIPRIQSVLEKSYDLLFQSKTQAYREDLLGCVLVRLLNPKVDIRLPYVQQGERAYSGRTLDEKVINPFLHKAKIPSLKGPFLSVFRRSVTFTEDTRAGLRDQKGFDAMLKVVGFIDKASNKKLHDIIYYHLYRFIRLREKSQIELIHPKRYFSQGYEVNFVEIKFWVCAVLTVLGVKGRTAFMDEFIHNLSAEDVPVALKQAWNDVVLRLTSDERAI